jgi:hypothetical protein
VVEEVKIGGKHDCEEGEKVYEEEERGGVEEEGAEKEEEEEGF